MQTIECIESLKTVHYLRKTIVVIDNNSRVEDLRMLAEYTKKEKIILLKNRSNLGFARGNNVGIRYALDHQTKYILLLNNDTRVMPNFLASLVLAVQELDQPGVVGPMILDDDASYRISFAGGRIHWFSPYVGEHLNLHHHLSVVGADPHEVDFITGACLLVSTNVIRAIGLLDEDFFMYYEDMEWCLRAKKFGFRNYLISQAIIYHKNSATVRMLPPAFYLYHTTRSCILLVKKQAPVFVKIFHGIRLIISLITCSIRLLLCIRKDVNITIRRAILDGWLGR